MHGVSISRESFVPGLHIQHKHIEHDPVTHACSKPKCDCSKFDSPWVCNCNHPWSRHSQTVVNKEVRTLADMMSGISDESIMPDVNRWDQLERGDWSDMKK
ncbi:hypothetical protein CYMTET_49051 [Cymbomonas tetramitiformis]|uniref:Uncharacterized protein n=1 Tax=Cymbomonas tetramitiformis TaxID=36881 RepID=A0AAE0EV46_9CHLO|nr:hypothetical protein CYMTET_49051 [Cymbomonas tetramitiformis]